MTSEEINQGIIAINDLENNLSIKNKSQQNLIEKIRDILFNLYLSNVGIDSKTLDFKKVKKVFKNVKLDYISFT